jgi:hypothetical protein
VGFQRVVVGEESRDAAEEYRLVWSVQRPATCEAEIS